MARPVTVVVIGAGHSGLAMSRCLSERSIDHVVLERGDVASAWRARWDSLRLLTPNWQCRLPGYAYAGTDPDGFMTKAQIVAFVEAYAAFVAAPVQTHTTVTGVSQGEDGYRVFTNRGNWRCRCVVVASGAFSVAAVPPNDFAVPRYVATLSAAQYRNVDALPPGGVLVVGASATGVQLADEIRRSGREVTLAVGEHVRMPRLYRGLDIQRWMDVTGLLDQRHDEVDDLVRARGVPSPQLIGSPERRTLDLNVLTERGVRLVGRCVGARDGRAMFSGSLRNHCALADLKLGRLLDGIDRWLATNDTVEGLADPERFAPTRVDASPRLMLDFAREGFDTVLWATGFRPDYSFLRVPVFDHKGRVRHDGGVVDAPGLYVMGLTFMRRRKSSFIHGAHDDAKELSDHLVAALGKSRRADAVVTA